MYRAMNIQAHKISSVIIICGATAAVFTIGFWIKYQRSKGKKSIKEGSEVDTCNKEIDSDVITNAADDIQALMSAKKNALEKIIPKEWKNIGRIKELYIYPLKSGRGKSLKDSVFTDHGISIINDGHYALRDRMFLVYKEETGEFKTGRNYPTLVLVTLSTVDEFHVKLEAVGMPSVTFKVPQYSQNNVTPIPCVLWWGEALDCIDCGSEVARWISRFLTGTNSGLRLGCALGKITKRIAEEEPWEMFDNIFTTLRNKETGLFSDLASYMVMSESSVNELNQKLDRPGPALQFRPNIVVSGVESFAEDNWEWIKIGESVAIRNIKPYSSFRQQRDPHRIQVDGKSPTVGIYCAIYQTGNVRIGDDVYIHAPTDELKSGDPKLESDHFLRHETKIDNRDSTNNRLS